MENNEKCEQQQPAGQPGSAVPRGGGGWVGVSVVLVTDNTASYWTVVFLDGQPLPSGIAVDGRCKGLPSALRSMKLYVTIDARRSSSAFVRSLMAAMAVAATTCTAD
ncbi:hypothetical protein Y032_0368g46 [Ancylostoma ceylanicum]|uniref:Uncharacterized protein n=1 Tax=Ancylostoma ceylanicum TaxID=53326 RepID=A0A016RUK8_9BILA|nr:hypothetical protein Y032_0368g46 [Ancylostoma ceylanicum]